LAIAGQDILGVKAALEKWGALKRPEVHWFRASPRYYPKPVNFNK